LNGKLARSRRNLNNKQEQRVESALVGVAAGDIRGVGGNGRRDDITVLLSAAATAGIFTATITT